MWFCWLNRLFLLNYFHRNDSGWRSIILPGGAPGCISFVSYVSRMVCFRMNYWRLRRRHLMCGCLQSMRTECINMSINRGIRRTVSKL